MKMNKENIFKFFYLFFNICFLIFSVFVLIYGSYYINSDFNRIEENCKNYFNVDSCVFVCYNGELVALPDLENNLK